MTKRIISWGEIAERHDPTIALGHGCAPLYRQLSKCFKLLLSAVTAEPTVIGTVIRFAELQELLEVLRGPAVSWVLIDPDQ